MCWGWNMRGQLGNGSAGGHRAKALKVKGLGPNARAVSIATGINFSCAAMADGTVRCWGGNTDGALGIGNTVDSPTPRAVAGLTDIVQVSASFEHVCARTKAGKLHCWGGGIRRFFGPLAAAGKARWQQTEKDDPLNQLKPMEIPFDKPITHVSLGEGFGCVLASDGTFACFGQLDGVDNPQRHDHGKDKPPFGLIKQDFRHAEM